MHAQSTPQLGAHVHAQAAMELATQSGTNDTNGVPSSKLPPPPGGISSYVVVTHQHSTIRRAVDRIIFLHKGTVVWEGRCVLIGGVSLFVVLGLRCSHVVTSSCSLIAAVTVLGLSSSLLSLTAQARVGASYQSGVKVQIRA